MSHSFFEQVDDEVRGLLGTRYADYRVVRASRLIKLALPDPSIHFEAQLISPRWAPPGAKGRAVIEVGLHLEKRSRAESEGILQRLTSTKGWKTKLKNAETGKAFGPQGPAWRRVSEVLFVEDESDPDVASEVAERLASYIKVLGPVVGRLDEDGGSSTE